MKKAFATISIFLTLFSMPLAAADNTFQDYQNYNHGYCPECSCYPCRCDACPDGTCPPPPNPCNTCPPPPDPCNTCAPVCDPCDPCDPCAPVCGTRCGISICAIGVAVAAVAAAGVLIVSSGGSTGHVHTAS